MVSVYVSYAWKEEEQNRLVDKLELACAARGIEVRRDQKAINYGDSIRQFMDRIGAAGHVVLILSDAYFKSEYCMYELRRIHESRSFAKRVNPIVLKGTRFHKAADRLPYIDHWQAEIDELQSGLARLSDPKYTGQARDELDGYAENRRLTDTLLSILADMNTLTEDVHVDSDFAALLDRIAPAPNGPPDDAFRARITDEIRRILDPRQSPQRSAAGGPERRRHPAGSRPGGKPVRRRSGKGTRGPAVSSDPKHLGLARSPPPGIRRHLERRESRACLAEPAGGRWREPWTGAEKRAGRWSAQFRDRRRDAAWRRTGQFPPPSDRDLRTLNSAQRFRERQKTHNHYVPVAAEQESRLCRPNFYRKLLAKLPAIAVIFFKSSGDRPALLISDEVYLMTIIREFLTIPERLAKKS